MSLALSLETAENVRDIALAAGEAILRIARSAFAVSQKSDDSPITAADREANRIILSALTALTPDVPVVSEEEEEEEAHTLHPPAGRFWLVDPLDGTREFIAGNGEYTVNIALIDNGRPVLGAVHAPALSHTFYGAAHCGAFQQRAGAPLSPLRARCASPDALVALASRSHLDARTEAYLRERPVSEIRKIGSSLKFCLLAAGEADLYPRFGRTMEWDTAAGHAVLAAAGGSVRIFDDTDLTYGKPGFENPGFVARGALV